MPNSWWPEPFPIRDEDVLCVACSISGFAEDLTDWEVRIADYGLLVQHVDVWELSRKSHFEQRIAELPAGFCDELRDKVAQIGFERFPERYKTTWDDLPSWHIEFRLPDGTIKKVDVECDPNRSGSEAQEVAQFLELWDLIHCHAPYEKPKRKHKRSGRQIKMDARRQRRIEKKLGSSESGPSDVQEGM